MNVSMGYIIQHDGLRVGHPWLTGSSHSVMLSAELADAKGCYVTCVCCWQLRVPLDVKIKFNDSCVLNCIEIDSARLGFLSGYNLHGVKWDLSFTFVVKLT
jgi:hypothetical protein